MQTIAVELPTLVASIKSGAYIVPRFQREFTWNEGQVKLLVDSLARSYPIGSLLVLPESGHGLQLNARDLDFEARGLSPAGETGKSDRCYVLDGQQRLTSIARAFLNAHPDKTYYFDLRKMFREFEQEGLNYITARKKGNDSPETKEHRRLVRADVVLNQQKIDIFVSEYFEDYEDLDELTGDKGAKRESAAKIKGIFETIRNYQIPIVVLDKNSGVESICRVFETINSTGTRLTTFDLAVARFYPSPDLRELMDETCKLHVLFGPKEFDLDGQLVLQTLALWDGYSRSQIIEPSRTALLNLDKGVVADCWHLSAKALAETMSWAQNEVGIRPDTIPSPSVLVPLAAARMQYRDEMERPGGTNSSLLRKWVFAHMLQQGARQASNYRIAESFRNLTDYFRDRGTLRVPEVRLTAANVVALRPSDTRYRAFQCLMMMQADGDLLSGRRLEPKAVEDHHIFPSAQLKKKGVPRHSIDSIANRTLISRDSNRHWSDSLPQEYFRELLEQATKDGCLPDTAHRLTSHFIPGDPTRSEEFLRIVHVDNFKDFCIARARLMLDHAQLILQDALIQENDDADDE